MATLTKTELKAALERAELHSLADDDVALQTSSRLPKDVDGVEPAELDTAGSEQHGAVYSYTRGQVAEAYQQLGGEFDANVREGEQARAQASEAQTEQAEQAQRPAEQRAEEAEEGRQASGPQAARRGSRGSRNSQ